jgi:hypothetical protein
VTAGDGSFRKVPLIEKGLKFIKTRVTKRHSSPDLQLGFGGVGASEDGERRA